jgi:hemoglobin
MHKLYRLSVLLLAASLLATAADSAGRAADEKDKDKDKNATAAMERKAIDALAFKTLREVINKGAAIYNEGDVNGCYRLYEGALVMVKPMLDHRPELQEAISKAIMNAEKTPQQERRAWVLREVIDKIREDCNPNPKSPSKVETKLWERLGGEAKVMKIVEDFFKAAAEDPKVNASRDGKYLKDDAAKMRVKQQLVDFISSKTGGPREYKGKDIKEAHKGMGITDEEFTATAKHFKNALKNNGVTDADIDDLMKELEKTRADIVEGKKPPPEDKGTEKKPLWERLDKTVNVPKAIDTLFNNALKDEKLKLYGGKDKQPTDKNEIFEIKDALRKLISSLTGGDAKFDEKARKQVDELLTITDEQLGLLLGHLKKALEDQQVKDEDIQELSEKLKKYYKDGPAKKDKDK